MRLYTQTRGPRAAVDGIAEHGAGQAHELLGEHARARVRTAAVHPLERRPPDPFLVARMASRAHRRAGERDRWDR